MATILRSSKYARCLNVFARRIVAGHDNGDFGRKLVALQARCVGPYLAKSYATVPVVQRNDAFGKIDNQVAKLDENIQRYGRIFKREVTDALAKFQDQGYVPSLDGLLLIRCCGELLVDTSPAAKNQLVQEIWNTLDNLNTPVDVSHFNALLRVYLENDNEFSPIEILAKMKDKGIEPNRVTYQRLIYYYCKKGDIEGATKILEFMREKGHSLNEGVFNALITGHSEANDMESAVNMLDVMKAAGVAPSSSTYTALLCAYAKRADMVSIKRLIDECATKDLFLHNKDLFEAIKVLAAGDYDSEIDELLTMMPKGPRYNFDAFHAIIKVLDVGNVDAAMKILLTMERRKTSEDEAASETEESMNGTFLIRKMITSKIPAEKVIQVCEQLENLKQHSRPFLIALEQSLHEGDTSLSLRLLQEYQERGESIREHYLWPILAAHGNVSNFQGVCDVLKYMTKELKIVPSVETVTDFVLPYFTGTWDDIISILKEYDIPQRTIVNSIAIRMLMDNKMRKTANFMISYPSGYDAKLFYRPLAEALRNTEDTRSFLVILQLLHESAIDQAKDGSVEESQDGDDGSVIDKGLRKAFLVLPIGRTLTASKLVNGVHEAGMKVSPTVGQQILQQFQNDLTPEISEKIEELTKGPLELKQRSELFTDPPEKENKMMGGTGQQTVAPFGSVFTVRRQQLNTALASRDMETIRSLIEDLEADGFSFSPALFAQIITVFCEAEDLEQAKKWTDKYKTVHPESSLDLHKAMQYALLLVKKGLFEDAIKFVVETPRKEETSSPGMYRLSRRVLDQVAETGDVEKTQKMLDALVASKYCSIDGYTLGSLVRAHLARNNLEGALEMFENICQNHNCTPMKNELSKKFIAVEDANSLQRLTDLSTQIHGESNSLVDLVLSFVECGRLRQARKIMETPGLKVRTSKVRVMATHYVEANMHKCLEQFVEITKGLPVIDRRELYDVLIDVYSKKNDWDRGLSLWTAMQEENIQPSPVFLDTLAILLIKNNKQVPFSYVSSDVDDTPETNQKQTRHSKPETSTNAKVTEHTKNLATAIEKGDLEEAEKIIANTPTTAEDYSTMVSTLADAFLTQRNDIDKANKILQDLMTTHSRTPRAGTLKAVWFGLIEAEKYEELWKYEKILGMRSKRKFRYAKFLNRAELKRVGLVQYLADLSEKVTESKEANFAIVKNDMHFTTLRDAISEEPSALAQVIPIAEKMASQEIYLPMNLVWAYYFEQNKPEADEIWEKYLSKAQWVVFDYFLKSSHEKNDLDTLERLHRLIDDSGVSSKAKATVASSLVDLHIRNERYDDALKVLQEKSPEAIKDIIKAFQPRVVEELKRGLEANGKSLPREIIENL